MIKFEFFTTMQCCPQCHRISEFERNLLSFSIPYCIHEQSFLVSLILNDPTFAWTPSGRKFTVQEVPRVILGQLKLSDPSTYWCNFWVIMAHCRQRTLGKKRKEKDGNSKDSEFNLPGQYANRWNFSTNLISLWSYGHINPTTIQRRYQMGKDIWNPQDQEINNQFLCQEQVTNPEGISRNTWSFSQQWMPVTTFLSLPGENWWLVPPKAPKFTNCSEYFLKAIWLNLKVNWNLPMEVWRLSSGS